MTAKNTEVMVEEGDEVGRRVRWSKETDLKLDRYADLTGLTIGEVVDILAQATDNTVKEMLTVAMEHRHQERMKAILNS